MQDDQPTQQADPIGKEQSIEAPERTSLLSEKQLGSIRLIGRIGRGGMGEVWLARHELLGRDVAVKILRANIRDLTDPAFTEFIQGAKVAASLCHTGLNKVHHADIVDGVPYLVLELLDGPNLHELIGRSGRLDLATARSVIEGVCDAVAELHQHDLVHRDLKPSNVMVTSDGRVVITDFGLACARAVSALRVNSGVVSGTPTYMAPEMFDGVVSARTDVYAIGMMAYELLCGKPGVSGTFDELQHQHRNVAINVQPLRAASVPDGVIDVVVRAASKDILFRPKTARHVLEGFRAAFDTAGIKSASPEALARLIKYRPPSLADQTPTPATTKSGDTVPTLSQFAAQKRDRRNSAQAQITVANEPLPQVNAGDVKRRSDERRKVWIAAVLALVGATFTALVLFLIYLRTRSHWENWVEYSLARKRVVGYTPAGFVMTTATPLWAQMLVILAPFVVFTIVTVGILKTVYRHLRGSPLPEDTENTRCGWCQHELRGLSEPICPECGHRIGDLGPDERGALPLSRRGSKRFAAWALLPLIFVVAMFLTAIVAMLLIRLAFRPPPGASIGGSIVMLIAVVVGLAITLAFYEASLQVNLTHGGRAWCRVCRGELRNLVEPICPACGSRI
jgi:serine/threonine protein kinase